MPYIVRGARFPALELSIIIVSGNVYRDETIILIRVEIGHTRRDCVRQLFRRVPDATSCRNFTYAGDLNERHRHARLIDYFGLTLKGFLHPVLRAQVQRIGRFTFGHTYG